MAGGKSVDAKDAKEKQERTQSETGRDEQSYAVMTTIIVEHSLAKKILGTYETLQHPLRPIAGGEGGG